jgi:hypothetical protein
VIAARPRISALLIGAMLATLVALGFADSASAAVKCQYDATTRQLSVSTTGGTEVSLRRAGESIRLSKFLGPDLACEGEPTVTNTDLIAISGAGFSGVVIDLKGGPFAPGATPEAGDSSEIEFITTGSGDPGGITVLQGTGRADHFRFMAAGGVTGLNLNPGAGDNDVEIEVPDPNRSNAIFLAAGGGGKDTIDVVGRPRLVPFAEGGAGDDTLDARTAFGSILDGGAGRDRILGSTGFDLIAPGRGTDRVSASGGADLIEVDRDGSQDRIDCGGGRDEVDGRDQADRLRSCERVPGGN